MRKPKRWKLLEEKDVSPSHWFPVYKHKVKLPNGKIINDYFISKLGDVAMIVVVTYKKEVAFVRQYKHAAGEIILELPAGRIGSKKPEIAAVEELEEETGFVVKHLEKLGKIFVAPTKDTTITHGFLARNIHKRKNQKLEENEDIEVVYIPAKDINEKIKLGDIKAADTIAIIRLAQLKAPELFK